MNIPRKSGFMKAIDREFTSIFTWIFICHSLGEEGEKGGGERRRKERRERKENGGGGEEKEEGRGVCVPLRKNGKGGGE